MKGPYERLKYDLRRVWECPVCQHHERTPGHVTSVLCRCQAKEPWTQRKAMRLLDDGPPRAARPPRSEPIPMAGRRDGEGAHEPQDAAPEPAQDP